MSELYNKTYNPDVLSCLANLSNDEVFTPPEVANQILDMLPKDIWNDPNTTFLDPSCKSGVFLREAAKRLIKGLEQKIPDLDERLEHIFKKQLYGIAITELTSLLSRRSIYCSKYPNSRYSVIEFNNSEGNIRYKRCEHEWNMGRCTYCGSSQENLDRGNDLETHAYEFIHTKNPKDLIPMKFDVIVGNPPYQIQVNEAGKGLGAIPIYQKFVEQALKLKPRYLAMIIPARWFAGGVGLKDFRKQMLEDTHLEKIVDYMDSKECFPGVDINGGICYFLWNRNHSGLCEYTCNSNGTSLTAIRKLNEFPIFIRRNEAVAIIKKVLSKTDRTLANEGGVSPQTPYGLLSTYRGSTDRKNQDDCEYLSSRGWSFVSRDEIKKGIDSIDLFKAMISKLSCEHAGNPDKNGMYRVFSRMEQLTPGQICSQSYLVVCPSESKVEAQNCYDYLRTKFVRFLVLQTLVGMNISINNFQFVPWLDFSQSWSDEKLYKKFNLTESEITFIESLIRPMDNEETK